MELRRALERRALELPPRVDVREVGMRDGLQLEDPVPLPLKLAMLEALVATGVRRIEVTSFVSPRAVPALADADAVAAELHRFPGVGFSALVANLRGAQRAVDAGIADLEYVVSAADSHSRANAGRSTAEAVEAVGAVAELAHAAGGTVEVIVATAWDCPFDGRTDPSRVLEVVRSAVAQGADQLCLGDTIGTVTPRRTVALLDAVRAAAPGVALGAHFHDTRGTGQANALAAVLAGITQLDASVGGLGGCPFAPGASGNIATEELVYWLADSGVQTGIDLDAVLVAAAATETAVGHPLPSSLHRAGGVSVPRGELGGRAPLRQRWGRSTDLGRIVEVIETADVARPAPLPSDRRRTSDGTVEVLIQGRTTTPLQTRRYFAILDATVERVRATGFDNAKMADIAADSGVALATVYRYFSSRDYLLHVALSRWLVDVNNSVMEPWREGRRLEEHLVTIVRASAAALIEEPLLLKAWARSNLSPDPCVVQLAHKGRLSDLAELYPVRMRDTVLLQDLTVQMEHAWFSGMVRWSLGQRDWEEVPRDVERAMLLVLDAHRDSVDLL